MPGEEAIQALAVDGGGGTPEGVTGAEEGLDGWRGNTGVFGAERLFGVVGLDS
jgi:hypothetical protein